MDEFYFYLFRNLLLFFLTISTLIGLVYFKRMPYPFKVIGVYVLVTLVLELGVIVLAKIGISNYFVIHLFTLLELVLLALFFQPLLKRPTFLATHFYKIILVVILIILANALFVQPISNLNSYSETLENVVLMAFSILLFVNMHLQEEEDPYRTSIIMINSGLLLYLSGSLFIFLFGEYVLAHSYNSQVIIWAINVMLNLIFKILILLALIKVVLIVKGKVKEIDPSL